MTLPAAAVIGSSALTAIAISADTEAETDTGIGKTVFLEAKQPQDPRFVTGITRLTTCKLVFEMDPHYSMPPYPVESRKNREQGRVVMQFHVDADRCVRKATIVESSGFFRLDKASLDFAMSVKLPASLLSTLKTVDDGELTFKIPVVWKLLPPVRYVPGDRCANGGKCVDSPPPPDKGEAAGISPDPSYIWMPGYYSYFSKTGFQWNDGQWESPRPGFHWSAPHWEQFHSKWVFTPGMWEPGE